MEWEGHQVQGLCIFVVSCYRHFPENSDLLATLGLLYLEAGQPKKAFQYLGNSLTYDPCNTKVQRTEMGEGSCNRMHYALTLEPPTSAHT